MLWQPDATTLASRCIAVAVLDAARLAERLHVKNLVLYHTEDSTLETRKKRYTAEADTAFSGHVFVPDDLERIVLCI